MHQEMLIFTTILLLVAVNPVPVAAQEAVDNQPFNAGDFVSESDRVFRDWNREETEIVATALTSQVSATIPVGKIREDGSFDFQLPGSVSTSVPVDSFANGCNNRREAVVKGSGVTLAYVGLFARKDEKIIGSLVPGIPVRAAYNMNVGNINNGNLGNYYVWVYSDGDAAVQIDCRKKVDMTDGKDVEYQDIEVEDRFNMQFNKGWNLVRAEVLDNLWVGLTKHYLKREWTVVSELPGTVNWVLRAVSD